MELQLSINSNKYTNIKQLLKEEFLISDRLLLKLKRENKIYINDKIVPINAPVKIDDIIKVNLDFEEDNSNIVPYEVDLDILYEDDYLLVINKPYGMAIHPSILHYDKSLSNGVKYYFDKINLKRKIRPVNRLDKDTSGIVIFAKNEYIQECLSRQMRENTFSKYYIALVSGFLKEKNGCINLPIARKENSIIERTVSKSGDSAITEYCVIKEFGNYSLLYITLKTGRTHQIRVHTSHIGHAIIGDSLYGSTSSLINRQALHACKINFIHPITKKALSIEAPIPSDINAII